jgi:hypothetical protein
VGTVAIEHEDPFELAEAGVREAAAVLRSTDDRC